MDGWKTSGIASKYIIIIIIEISKSMNAVLYSHNDGATVSQKHCLLTGIYW